MEQHENKNTTQFIDVEVAIQSKNPKLLKVLPKFVINYIKKVLHQNEINNIFNDYKNLQGLDFTDALLKHFNIKIEIFGFENVLPNKKNIFVANHPIGGFESIGLMNIVGQKYPNLKFLVNDVLLQIKNLSTLFIPINKFGNQAKNSVLKIEEAYNSENQILIFPAGIVSRKINGKIQDFKWQKSFITKSVQHKRDVIPVFISAKNSSFFYNLALIRTKLGIKANLEMFYLADESFKQKNKTISFYFGKPIEYTNFNKQFTPDQWAAKVREHVYNLSKNYNKSFQ